MTRMFLIWVIASVAIGFGISGWRSLTGKEQWRLTKYVAYATICSSLAAILLSFMVVMF